MGAAGRSYLYKPFTPHAVPSRAIVAVFLRHFFHFDQLVRSPTFETVEAAAADCASEVTTGATLANVVTTRPVSSPVEGFKATIHARGFDRSRQLGRDVALSSLIW
jgi:multidrug efflux pump subunit AcrA (membrane-fusion protein)